MTQDPAVTNPELYKVIFENDRVRVLEYTDKPGDKTALHGHPDSVMFTLSSFRRRLTMEGRQVEVELRPGEVRWLDSQQHAGENIGDTDTHSIFIELKEPRRPSASPPDDALGPRAT